MTSIKNIIENNETFGGRIFNWIIQILILVSIISFSIETLPNLHDGTRRILRYIEIATVSIFTLEYLLRIIVADKKLRFIFSFFGIIDLLAILPFYITTGLDLRSLRALRLLRTLRLLKLVRYSKAVQRFATALKIVKEEFVLFFFIALILFYMAGVGVYFFEREAQPEIFVSVFDALWWSVVTLTTVGYGDVYPITVGGKLFTFIVLMIGLGFIAVPTGLIASAMSKAREMEEANSE